MASVGPTNPEALAGSVLSGGYRLVRLLDAGGAGVVYEGRDAGDRPVAVKVLRSEIATEEIQSRITRQAGVLAKISRRGSC